MNTKLFPIALIVMQSAAAVVYFRAGDWRHGLYWTFAVGLTCTVTF